MRKGFILFLLLFIFLRVFTVKVSAQESSLITVKGHESINRVVILDIQKATKQYELQCNEGMTFCAPLKNGRYLMVELPKNFGIYDCRNVEIYPESADTSGKDQKLGEYCLIEK